MTAVVLGSLILVVAAVTALVFAEVDAGTGSAGRLMGLSAGTLVYVAGYAGAGAVLIVAGILKLRRSR